MLTEPRAAFLLLLAIGITLLFFWMIKDFILAILLAAVLAGMVYPFYSRLAEKLRGHKSIASGLTVMLSLLLIIIPTILLIGLLVGEAIDISESAKDWVEEHEQQPDSLRQRLKEFLDLKRLLPFQDAILNEASQLTYKAGSYVAKELATGARGTAVFLMNLFVMLFATFYFLIGGREILESMLRFTPLSEQDKSRLLGTYASVGRATVKGTLIIGIVQGGLGGLSFWLAGIEGAVFWSVIMAVFSIIPGIGTALIWIPASIFLLISGKTVAAVGVALWCAVVVGSADNILRPVLVGKDTGMSDLLVLLTTLGGLTLFGPVGIIIGPIIGVLFKTVWQLWGRAVEDVEAAAGEEQPGEQGG